MQADPYTTEEYMVRAYILQITMCVSLPSTSGILFNWAKTCQKQTPQ